MSNVNPSTKVILDFPVDYQSKRVAEIVIRRPKGRDMRFFPRNAGGDNFGPEDMYPFYAQLIVLPSGESPGEEFIDELDMADLNKVSEAVAAFLESRGRKSPARLRPAK